MLQGPIISACHDCAFNHFCFLGSDKVVTRAQKTKMIECTCPTDIGPWSIQDKNLINNLTLATGY
jgi:hypothetical protein